jgi:hypothetical protein
MDELMLTVADYAERADLSARQVQRYLADGRLPGARKIGGKWLIPATARPSSYDVVPTSQPGGAELLAAGAALGVLDSAEPSLGRLVELDDAAAELGTTVGGVRRLGAAGLLTVGRFGPRGSLRVWIPA